MRSVGPSFLLLRELVSSGRGANSTFTPGTRQTKITPDTRPRPWCAPRGARQPFRKRNENPMTYYIYQDTQRQWRWTLEAANNRKIANSGEGYHNKDDCLRAIALVKGSANAPIYQR